MLAIFCLAFLLLVKFTGAGPPSRAPLSASGGLKCEDMLRKLKDLRVGRKGESVMWYYTGVIRNPVSGSEVVGIEGVERCVEVPGTFFEGEEDNSKGSTSFTFLSSKLFVYTDLQNRTKPVTLYRVQPAAPARPVNPLSELNCVVTLGYRRRAVASDSPSGSKQGAKGKREGVIQKSQTPFDFFSVVRWPSGRAIHTNNIEIAPTGSNDVPGVGSRKAGQALDVIHYINGISACKNVTTSTRNYGGIESSAAEMLSKRGKFNWRKWITFSGSGSQPWYGKSQEYYTISAGRGKGDGWLPSRMGLSLVGSPSPSGAEQGGILKQPLATMRYTRFGEGPEWYAAGRPCSTELYAFKYNSVRDVPVQARDLLQGLCPQFFEIDGSDVDPGIVGGKTRSRQVRRPSLFTKLQEQAKLRLQLRDSVKSMHQSSPKSQSVSSSALSLAEADLLDNVNRMKVPLGWTPPSSKSGSGPKWGSPDAFRLSTDMRASSRFMPWWKKLPFLSKK